jgi:hypothetical protein
MESHHNKVFCVGLIFLPKMGLRVNRERGYGKNKVTKESGREREGERERGKEREREREREGKRERGIER